MRIHGVQLNGLDSPRGVHQLACEPGYTVFACAEADSARRLLQLVRALLSDPASLADPEGWISGMASDARADLSLSSGPDAYRVVADLGGRRVALASYGPDRTRPQGAATETQQILRQLRAVGLPGPADFERLFVWTGEAAPAPPPAEERAVASAGRSASHERRDQLLRARALFVDLEQRLKLHEEALEALSPMEQQLDGLDARIAEFQIEAEQRRQALESIAEHREALQRDRRRLRGAPGPRSVVAWTGLALAALGAGGAYRFRPEFWALAALGAGLCLAGALAVRLSRRAFGRVESRLATLRSDERQAELRFHNETLPIRKLVQALELESVDALLQVADEYRDLLHQVEDTRSRLVEARRALPLDTDSILAAMPPDEAPQPLACGPDEGAELESLLEVAARTSGLALDEVRARLGPVLPIYLRALTGGSGTQGSTLQGAAALSGLDAAGRARVCLAFRLALLEALAGRVRIPLLVGPEESSGDTALARSLKRLAAVAQVLHFSAGEGPETGHADRVHRLG